MSEGLVSRLDVDVWLTLGKDVWSMVFERLDIFYMQWTVPRVCRLWHTVSHHNSIWRPLWNRIPLEEQAIAHRYWGMLSLRSKIRNLCFGWYLDSNDNQRMWQARRVLVGKKYIHWTARVAFHHMHSHYAGEHDMLEPMLQYIEYYPCAHGDAVHIKKLYNYVDILFWWAPKSYGDESILGSIPIYCCDAFERKMPANARVHHFLHTAYHNVIIEPSQNRNVPMDLITRMRKDDALAAEPQRKKQCI